MRTHLIFDRPAIITVVCVVLATGHCAPSLFAQGTEQNPPQMSNFTLVNNLIKQRQFDMAEKLLDKELKAEHDPFAAYLWLGYLELRRGRTFASIRDYSQAERLKPNLGKVHRLLAIDYFILDQRALFQQEIQLALSDDPKDEQAYYVAGRFAYEVEKHFDVASNYFSKAMDLDPSDYKVHYYLGLSDKALDKGTEAQTEFERACELVRSSHAIYDLPFRDMAKLYLDEGDSNLALTYSEEAIAISPDSAENYFLRGRAEFSAGKLEAAIESLKRSASLDSTYAEPYYILGRIYMRIGDPDLARHAFKRFQEIRKEYDGR